MSRTEIYLLGPNAGEIAEIGNAWRGGMYVWDDMARRYFGLEGFPLFDTAKQSEVWNADSHHDLPSHEIIVLRSTMDKAVVCGGDLPALLDAFDRYGAEHPDSSMADQAKALREAVITDADYIAWNQTSVGEFWGITAEDDEGERTFYDPRIADEHFDVIATVKP